LNAPRLALRKKRKAATPMNASRAITKPTTAKREFKAKSPVADYFATLRRVLKIPESAQTIPDFSRDASCFDAQYQLVSGQTVPLTCKALEKS
jgi:hypothetical protein